MNRLLPRGRFETRPPLRPGPLPATIYQRGRDQAGPWPAYVGSSHCRSSGRRSESAASGASSAVRSVRSSWNCSTTTPRTRTVVATRSGPRLPDSTTTSTVRTTFGRRAFTSTSTATARSTAAPRISRRCLRAKPSPSARNTSSRTQPIYWHGSSTGTTSRESGPLLVLVDRLPLLVLGVRYLAVVLELRFRFVRLVRQDFRSTLALFLFLGHGSRVPGVGLFEP